MGVILTTYKSWDDPPTACFEVGTSGIRAHLGLQIPLNCAVRVGCNALTWREGEWTIFNGHSAHSVGKKVLGCSRSRKYFVDPKAPGKLGKNSPRSFAESLDGYEYLSFFLRTL